EKKNYAVLPLACLLLATNIQAASYPENYLDQAEKNYERLLHTENTNVRNSAIFQILRFKARYPDRDFSRFIKEFRKMSQEDGDFINQIHAQLAVCCLCDCQILKSVNPWQYKDSVIFFSEIYAYSAKTSLANTIADN
ncbi:hypothetical protein KAH55_01495, partial [bacterium]|nr:hypothetical protein [bacterium]